MLSRNEMEQVIRNGGSVLHGGRILTKMEHLPTDADLAVGNPEQEAQAAAALEAQIVALQAQHARLTQAKAPQTGAPAAGWQSPAGTGGVNATAQPITHHPTPDARPTLADTVGQELADRLASAGYTTPEAIQAASDDDLLALKGIGPGTLRQLRQTYGAGR
jgi:hypothetical protein